MFAKIKETTLAADDEISKNIVGLARTRPDIFGTTEEEVSNAVKAEIEKKKDEQPKQVIWWDGHTSSIGHTANQAMSQNTGVDNMSDPAAYYDGRGFPGPAPPPPRPLPPPPYLALNIPQPPTMLQYPNPTHPLVVNVIPHSRPSVSMMHGQPLMASRPPMPPNIPVPPPPGPGPGSQHTPLGGHRQLVPVPMAPPPLMPLGMHPPPPPEEPEPKRQKLDDSMLIPEDLFLAQHPGSVLVSIAMPSTGEGNLKGQVLEIALQSLCETVGSLKEKIAGEIQLPANKQKLSGKAGFLKDNVSLAYYNVAPGGALSLSLREGGGRKR